MPFYMNVQGVTLRIEAVTDTPSGRYYWTKASTGELVSFFRNWS